MTKAALVQHADDSVLEPNRLLRKVTVKLGSIPFEVQDRQRFGEFFPARKFSSLILDRLTVRRRNKPVLVASRTCMTVVEQHSLNVNYISALSESKRNRFVNVHYVNILSIFTSTKYIYRQTGRNVTSQRKETFGTSSATTEGQR